MGAAPLSQNQVALVKATWRDVEPTADAAARLFYDRLFQIDATAAPLFRGADLPEQRRKLVAALGLVARGLDDLAALAPALADLGRRHAGYGVTDAHYDSVGQALLWTLERGLGPAWTPAVRTAWADAYGLLAGVMKGAADELSV